MTGRYRFNKTQSKVLALSEPLPSDLISGARYIRRKRLVIITRRWRLRAKGMKYLVPVNLNILFGVVVSHRTDRHTIVITLVISEDSSFVLTLCCIVSFGICTSYSMHNLFLSCSICIYVLAESSNYATVDTVESINTLSRTMFHQQNGEYSRNRSTTC